MSHVVSADRLAPADRIRLRELTRAPGVAWPTVVLAVLVIGGVVVSDALAVSHRVPLGVGMLVNGALGYYAFSVVHDAIHGAIARRPRLNDAIGALGLFAFVPYASLGLLRWAHVQHHRFTNGPKDPDLWVQGPWWQLPFRWMVIDLAYLFHARGRMADKIVRPHFVRSLWMTAATLIVVSALVASGHGLEVLVLWYLPSRLLFLGIGFAFFWLPHVPHDTTAAEHPTRATTIREGHAWLWSPMLQFQNYHLIHHLYPTTPFYNNGKVWTLVEGELRRHDLAIQRGFAIHPTIHPGSEASA